MDIEKDTVNVHTVELSSQTSLAPPKSIYSGHTTSSSTLWPLNAESLPTPWPTQPQDLKETGFSYWANVLYDVAICLAPLLMLVKIGLVIWSYNYHNDPFPPDKVSDPSTQPTGIWVRFNHQVRNFNRYIFSF